MEENKKGSGAERRAQWFREHQILTDGAMGTYYGEKFQKTGKSPERQNIREPERILEIHREYLRAGAQLIRTNTFSSNLETLFGTQPENGQSRQEQLQELAENVKAAFALAKQAAAEINPTAVLAGDIGPIPESGGKDAEEILEEYYTIGDALLKAGAEVIWFETFSDFQYILPVAEYLKGNGDVFVMASFCLNKFGYTRSGISARRILETAAESPVLDGVGFNCGIGSTHMYRILKHLDFGGLIVSVIPNSGYPDILKDRSGYQENISYFCENMKDIAALGINFLGGCCGTTPAYIRALAGAFHGQSEGENASGAECPTASGSGSASGAEGLTAFWSGSVSGAECLPVSGSGTGRFALRQKRKHQPLAAVGEILLQKERNPFYQKLMSGEKAVVAELDPPHNGDCEKIIQGALLIKEAGVDLVTFSDSPMGKLRADSVLTGAKIQRETEMPVMPHVTCRDKNRLGMGASFFGAHMNGIRNMLLITGDPVPQGDRSGITPVFDFHSVTLMEYLHQMNLEYFREDPIVYGGALNYGRANLEKELERMEKKYRAGADFFLTQPIFCREDAKKVAFCKKRMKEKGLDVKILCGIMPLVSYRNASFMKNEVFGIRVPEEIVARYRKDMTREEGEETGIAIALELAEQLAGTGDGYYFMAPFNRASMVARILKKMP